MIEDLPASRRKDVTLIALCLPTPRDATTDRVQQLFDIHINLVPGDKSVFSIDILFNLFDFFFVAD